MVGRGRGRRGGMLLAAAVVVTGGLASCGNKDGGSAAAGSGSGGGSGYCQFVGQLLAAKPGGGGEAAQVPPSEAEKQIESARDGAPSEVEATLDLLGETAKAVAGGGKSDSSKASQLNDGLKLIAERAPTDCPDGGPYWRCATQAKMQAIGTPVDGGEPPAATPEAAVEKVTRSEKRVELSRTELAVRFGWVDAKGSVVQAIDVEKKASGWVRQTTRSCR